MNQNSGKNAATNLFFNQGNIFQVASFCQNDIFALSGHSLNQNYM